MAKLNPTVATPAAAPAANPAEHRRLSMQERLTRKTAKMGAMTVALDEVPYNVTVTGRIPVELIGHLIDLNDKYVVFRYKKERSSKTVISRFLVTDVVRIIGEVGEPASIVVMRTAPCPSAVITGRVTVLKNGYVKVVADNGDSMLVNPNLRLENFSLYINAEMSREEDAEEGGATAAAAAPPVRKAAKQAAAPTAAPTQRSGKVTQLPQKPQRRPAAPTVQAFEEEDGDFGDADDAFAA